MTFLSEKRTVFLTNLVHQGVLIYLGYYNTNLEFSLIHDFLFLFPIWFRTTKAFVPIKRVPIPCEDTDTCGQWLQT